MILLWNCHIYGIWDHSINPTALNWLLNTSPDAVTLVFHPLNPAVMVIARI